MVRADTPATRSEAEIRHELQRIAEWSGGSYEELAGAARALAWVLGESDETVIPRDLHGSDSSAETGGTV